MPEINIVYRFEQEGCGNLYLLEIIVRGLNVCPIEDEDGPDKRKRDCRCSCQEEHKESAMRRSEEIDSSE